MYTHTVKTPDFSLAADFLSPCRGLRRVASSLHPYKHVLKPQGQPGMRETWEDPCVQLHLASVNTRGILGLEPAEGAQETPPNFPFSSLPSSSSFKDNACVDTPLSETQH